MGTARGMDATSVRKTLAFARTTETKQVLGAWGVLIYNWARECRSLKRPLPQPQGRRVYERTLSSDGCGANRSDLECAGVASLTYVSEWGAEIISHYDRKSTVLSKLYGASGRM